MGEVLSLFRFRFVFFFSFSRSLLTFFPQGLSHRDVATPLSLINSSGGWSPFFKSTQPHHAAADVWFRFGFFFLVHFPLVLVALLLPRSLPLPPRLQ